MEDVNAIHRIFKNLKYEMDNNGWVYQWHLGDEPIKVTHDLQMHRCSSGVRNKPFLLF